MAKVKVTESVSELVTRSPIELFWTAKKNKQAKAVTKKVSLTFRFSSPAERATHA